MVALDQFPHGADVAILCRQRDPRGRPFVPSDTICQISNPLRICSHLGILQVKKPVIAVSVCQQKQCVMLAKFSCGIEMFAG